MCNVPSLTSHFAHSMTITALSPIIYSRYFPSSTLFVRLQDIWHVENVKWIDKVHLRRICFDRGLGPDHVGAKSSPPLLRAHGPLPLRRCARPYGHRALDLHRSGAKVETTSRTGARSPVQTHESRGSFPGTDTREHESRGSLPSADP